MSAPPIALLTQKDARHLWLIHNRDRSEPNPLNATMAQFVNSERLEQCLFIIDEMSLEPY